MVERGTQAVGDALGNPIDKLGEVPVVGPGLAAGALGFVETANPGKGAKSAADARPSAPPSAPPTVMRPKREAMFPGVYKDPGELVAGAKVAPEDPAMQQLFGVNRQDLFDIAEQGTRKGNMTERPFAAAAKGKGAAHASEVMNPRNTQRMLDIIGEARKRPDLFQGMASWYTMDPLYRRFEELYGPEQAVAEYKRFNTLTGMASPGSEVLTEMNRGTAANWLDKEGRFEDFVKHGGGMTKDRPADMAKVMGHAYHKTAQAGPMAKYLRGGGELDMGSAKVPSYIHASGVPETGFQTAVAGRRRALVASGRAARRARQGGRHHADLGRRQRQRARDGQPGAVVEGQGRGRGRAGVGARPGRGLGRGLQRHRRDLAHRRAEAGVAVAAHHGHQPPPGRVARDRARHGHHGQDPRRQGHRARDGGGAPARSGPRP